MNYWKYIIIGLLGFVALFHAAVIWYIRGENYELTSPDYYDRELRYQERIDKLRAGKAYAWSCRLSEDQRWLELQVVDPNGAAVVLSDISVTLYRPNDAGLDRQLLMEPGGSSGYRAPLAELEPGLWKVTVDATNDRGTALAYQTRLSSR